MSVSHHQSTVLIVDPFPLHNLGLVSVLERLSAATKFRITSLTPEDAEQWIDADSPCSMIIYNIGGGSLGEHKHAKRIKALRTRAKGAPLVILSDNDSRTEVVSAFKVGAQGFLSAGTSIQLAQQALSFIFQGGSYFPSPNSGRHHRSLQANERIAAGSPVAEHSGPIRADGDLTERQKAVLERLEQGESNKTIARHLGIREGTVKVHVRQIMRKMGATNRTQVAIARANGGAADTSSDDHDAKGK